MKLSYKSNAWPNLTWNEHCDLAEKMELDGIEFCYAPTEASHIIDDAHEKQEFLRRLSEKLLETSCVTVDISGDNNDELQPALKDAAACIELARLLRSPYVCLDMDHETEADEARLVSVIGVLLPKAEAEGIVLLVETKGVYSDTGRLTGILERFASDNLAALWNLHNTFRFGGETADATIRNLGAYVKLVHVCDSFESCGDVLRCLTGDGEVPMADMLRALRSIDYKGHLTLDMACDNSGLNDADVILPHYANAISRLTETRARAPRHYDNIRKTGKYIWPKDELLEITFSQMLDRVTDEFPD